MKIMLETHRYAPELNKVWFGRDKIECFDAYHQQKAKACVSAPGITTIKDWRKRNKPYAESFRHATVEATYPDPKLHWLNKKLSGKVDNYAELLAFKHTLERKLIPNVGAYVRVKTQLIG